MWLTAKVILVGVLFGVNNHCDIDSQLAMGYTETCTVACEVKLICCEMVPNWR